MRKRETKARLFRCAGFIVGAVFMSATLTACDTKTTENKDETIVEQVVSQADTQTTDVLSALSMPKISSDNIDSQNSVIDTSYQKDASRFDMNEAKVSVEKADNNVKINQSRQIALLGSFDHNELPASKIKEDFSKLLKEVEEDNKLLSSYKKKIDKNSNDEQRARTQLVKLQVVLNEIEVKVNEYHLPAIAASYREDLKKGRGKVARIKELLEEIALNIE